jgi:hypothetical protein
MNKIKISLLVAAVSLVAVYAIPLNDLVVGAQPAANPPGASKCVENSKGKCLVAPVINPYSNFGGELPK